MEAIGFIASTAQISAYLASIANTVQEVRAYLKSAPLQLQDRLSQLDLLSGILERIQHQQDLHDARVAKYLLIIQRHISSLAATLDRHSKRLDCRSQRGRVWVAVRAVGSRNSIEGSFVELWRHCDALGWYLHIKRTPPYQALEPFRRQSDRRIEMEGSKKHGSMGESRDQSPAKEPAAAREKADDIPRTVVEGMMSQFFKGTKATGKGSMNRIGNHNHSQPMNQSFEDQVAEDGGQNVMGNTAVKWFQKGKGKEK